MSKKRSMNYLTTNAGRITISDEEYECSSAVSIFQLNAIPMCKVVIGNGVGNLSQSELYQKLNNHAIGNPIEIEFVFNGNFIHAPSATAKPMTDQKITVFKGYFLGWSPVVRGKSVETTVWAIHDIGRLDWSTLMVDDLHGVGLSDHKIRTVVKDGEAATPYMPGQYGTDVVEDIWESLIKKEFILAAESMRFGRTNTSALDVLNKLDLSKDELPLSLNLAHPNRVIIDIRRTLQSAGSGASMWDALVYLADKYLFAVSPRVDGFSIIPFSALLQSSANIPLLDSSEFVAENNVLTHLSRVFREFSIVEEAQAYSSAFDVVFRKPDLSKLSYEVPGLSDNVGALAHYKAPPWLQVGNAASYHTKNTVGVGGLVKAVGYAVEDVGDAMDEHTANAEYNDSGEDGKNYVQSISNDLRYKTRVGYLRSGIRFDLAPGSLISVGNPVADKEEPAYFATIHTVCTSLLVHPNTTGTWIVLDNIRTAKEQELVSNSKHPLYNNTWISAPIIDPESAGLAAHIDNAEVE